MLVPSGDKEAFAGALKGFFWTVSLRKKWGMLPGDGQLSIFHYPGR